MRACTVHIVHFYHDGSGNGAETQRGGPRETEGEIK